MRQQIGVTMPCLQAPLVEVPLFARAAEDAGFDSAWDYEFFRNPFVMHAAAAATTTRIQLAVGLAVAPTRTPFEMANAAADVDELANGRLLLGVGIGGPEFVETLHGASIARPVNRMREYLTVLRRSWEFLSTGTAEPFDGERERYSLPAFNPWGTRTMARSRIPTYLGAMGPRMLQLAGELADGTIGYLQTPRYVRECVLPNLEIGARRGARNPASVEVVGMVICSISDDRTEALRRARIQVGMYVAHPSSDRVVAFHGLEADQHALRAALLSGGVGALENATSHALVETFSISGTPEEARRQALQYEGVLPHLVLHTPYMPPLSIEETRDAYSGILRTFSR
ncbi:MAG: LLM class flavin-dependent oxidoreductase [Sporichthyaceae bacterium]